MCKYCEIGMSMVNTNMVRMAVDRAMKDENNAWIECLNIKGEKIQVPCKLNYCPMCGEKL